MEKNITKINSKNYIILGLIILCTITAVFYARSWYIMAKNYNANNSVIATVASPINQNEITNHVLENPNAILYISSGQNQNIKAFEKSFKNVIQKNHLNELMIYLDKDQISDYDALITSLKAIAKDENIKEKITKDGDVTMYLFENGKIKYIINNASNYSMSYLEKILKKQGMIDHE